MRITKRMARLWGKRFLLVVLLIGVAWAVKSLLVTAGCSHPNVGGSGVSMMQTRNVADFSNLVAVGPYDIHVHCQQPTQSIELQGDSNIVPLVTMTAASGKLFVTCPKGLIPKLPLQVTINVPHIDSVNLSGDAKLDLLDCKSDYFSLTNSSAGYVHLVGQVGTFHLDCGGADVAAREMPVQKAVVHLTGRGNVRLFVTGSLDATVKGDGTVAYSGHPASVDKHVLSGDGAVREVDASDP